MGRVYIVSHKPITTRLHSAYEPIFVGPHSSHLGQLTDATGENISERNSSFCELTAQYWIWKNKLPTVPSNDWLGFCHYRRYFSINEQDNWDPLVSPNDVVNQILLNGNDVIIPQTIKFRHPLSYVRQLQSGKIPHRWLTLKEQYKLCHDEAHMELAISLLPKKHKQDFLIHMNGFELTPYNMYIARPKILDEYFKNLFIWLFKVEKETKIKGADPYQSRFLGFLAERFCSYYFNRFTKNHRTPIIYLDDVNSDRHHF